MADIITSGASTIAPTIILGYSAKREAQSIVHTILGNPAPDITLRPASLRSGTLSLGFAGASSEADSKSAADVLALGAACSLSSTDRTTVAMPFVVQGPIVCGLDDSTRNAWVVSFDFQETA